MIQSDDFKVGMLVTVLRGEMIDRVAPACTCGASDARLETGEQFEDVRLNGVPMKVVAVSRPYIVVEILAQRWTSAGSPYRLQREPRVIFDTRRWQFAKCSRDYARAVTGEAPPAKPRATKARIADDGATVILVDDVRDPREVSR